MGDSPLIQDLRFIQLWYYKKKIVYSIAEGLIEWKTKIKSNSVRKQA